MNKRLDEALTQVKALSEDEQEDVADILLEYLEGQKYDVMLTPEQTAEVRQCMSDSEPYATDEEVAATFGRLTGRK